MNGIGWAVKQMYNGSAVAREEWHKGKYLRLRNATDNQLEFIYVVTPDGHVVPWVAHQADLLVSDWYITHGNIVWGT